MKLYEIAEEYEKSLDELLEMEGLTPEIIEDSLAVIKSEVEDKGRAVMCYALNLDADINQLKELEDRIKKKRQALENNKQKMRDYLRYNMIRCGITKIEDKHKLWKAHLVKGSESVEVLSVDDLPDNYVRVKKEPDKSAIKKALKSGEEIKGCSIVTGEDVLKIS